MKVPGWYLYFVGNMPPNIAKTGVRSMSDRMPVNFWQIVLFFGTMSSLFRIGPRCLQPTYSRSKSEKLDLYTYHFFRVGELADYSNQGWRKPRWTSVLTLGLNYLQVFWYRAGIQLQDTGCTTGYGYVIWQGYIHSNKTLLYFWWSKEGSNNFFHSHSTLWTGLLDNGGNGSQGV